MRALLWAADYSPWKGNSFKLWCSLIIYVFFLVSWIILNKIMLTKVHRTTPPTSYFLSIVLKCCCAFLSLCSRRMDFCVFRQGEIVLLFLPLQSWLDHPPSLNGVCFPHCQLCQVSVRPRFCFSSLFHRSVRLSCAPTTACHRTNMVTDIKPMNGLHQNERLSALKDTIKGETRYPTEWEKTLANHACSESPAPRR